MLLSCELDKQIFSASFRVNSALWSSTAASGKLDKAGSYLSFASPRVLIPFRKTAFSYLSTYHSAPNTLSNQCLTNCSTLS